jgi:copper chaperone
VARETGIIGISGMTCEHCRQTVEKSLRSLSGVDKVKVSLEAGRVEVTYDPDRVALSRIRAAVVEAGYTPKD